MRKLSWLCAKEETPMKIKNLTIAAFAAIVALAAAANAAEAAAKKRVALLLYSHGFQFMVALDRGARAEATRLGLQITVLDGQSDSQVQTQQIEDLLTRGVDAIVISANDSKQIVPAIREANAAKVPVIALDAVIAKGPDVVTYVGFANADGARMAANYMLQHVKSGTVIELEGALGAYHAQERHRGFTAGMAADPQIKIVSKPAEWLAENAQAMTADAVTSIPDLKGIFSHNDEMIGGVMAALRQTNKLTTVGTPGHIVVVGIDGTPDALKRIREGTEDATVNQDPFKMGAIAIDSALDAIEGKPVPKQQLYPPTLVTKANVDDPKLWGNRF
jgi:ribose transport system substrate-binding protein